MSFSKNRTRYFFLQSQENADILIPFDTLDDKVHSSCIDALPEELQNDAGFYGLITFTKIADKHGWKVAPNMWHSNSIRIWTKGPDEWVCRCEAIHKVLGIQRTKTVVGVGWTEVIRKFWRVWTDEIYEEFGHLSIHTHLSVNKNYVHCQTEEDLNKKER